jgi:hypothetical protein
MSTNFDPKLSMKPGALARAPEPDGRTMARSLSIPAARTERRA